MGEMGRGNRELEGIAHGKKAHPHARTHAHNKHDLQAYLTKTQLESTLASLSIINPLQFFPTH